MTQPRDPVEDGDPSQDQRAFRRCLGQFSTGVTVMTALVDGRPIGVTANSFSSLSMDPPLILWSIATTSRSFEAFQRSRHFVVNILGVEQVDLSQRFASSAEDKFADVDWRPGCGAAPILPGILASLECETNAVHEGGDHVILVGRVQRYTRYPGAALLYAQGRYAIAEDHPMLMIRSTAPSPRPAEQHRAADLRFMALLAFVEMYGSDAFDKHRQAEGVNLPQSRSMYALSAGEALPLDEIVRRSYLSQVSADDALAGLAEGGFVQSENGAFSLTASGHTLFSRLLKQLDRFECEQLQGIPQEELGAARKVLETLYERLRPIV